MAEADDGVGEKPRHYKIVTFSLYTADVEQLDAKVAELKRRGWTRANKSHLIRLALAQLDLDQVERSLDAAGLVVRNSDAETSRG